MNLLAVDTATEACSAALWVNGEVLERYEIAPRQHARLIMPMIDELLSEADLKPAQIDGLVLGRGPGSFTGVRIAAATVQGISMVTDCPVVPVSSLAAMAHRAWREHQLRYCIALIDARMNQVYWSCFETSETGKTRALVTESVSDPIAITAAVLPQTVQPHQWVGAGSGMQAYSADLGIEGLVMLHSAEVLLPAARDMLDLAQEKFVSGDTVSAIDAVPVYLRDNVALTEQERNAAAQKKPR